MIIHSKRIYMEDGCKAGYLEINDRKIVKYYPEKENIKADIDYGNNRILPGIFDTHNHGGFGYCLMEKTNKENVKKFLKQEASFGVVNMLATTAGLENIALLADEVGLDQDGTRILGIHSEGPWVNRVGEKGIDTGHPQIDLEYARKMVEDGNGKLSLVALAPELENGIEVVKYFKSNGINTAICHTNSNYVEANEAIDAGVSVATHLGNVMTGLHHRDVGTLGACLLRNEVDCEMICDGMHISLPMIQIYLKIKNHDQLFMISDNVSYAGLPAGRYLGFQSEGDRAYINVTEDGFVLSDTGRLSGSSKPVLFGIQNLVEKIGIPMEECCKFFSYNPIRKYSDPNKKGSLKEGKDADFIVISDDYQCLATYSEGKKVFDIEIDKVKCNSEFLSKKI